MRAITLLLTAFLFSTNSVADTVYTYDINTSYDDGAGDTGTYSGTFQYDATTQQITTVSGTLTDTPFGTSQTTWSYDTAYAAQYGAINTGFYISANDGYPTNEFLDFFMNGTTSYWTDWVQVLIAGIGTSTPTLDSTSLGVGSSPGNTVGDYNIPIVSGSITEVAFNSSVPEPASIALLASGLLGFGVSRKKAKHA